MGIRRASNIATKRAIRMNLFYLRLFHFCAFMVDFVRNKHYKGHSQIATKEVTCVCTTSNRDR